MTGRDGAAWDRAVLEQAAHWLSLLSSGAVSAQERDACRRWRDAAPAHEAAWRHLERVWESLAEPAGALPGAQARGLVNRAAAIGARPRRGRTLALKAMLAAVLMAPLCWALLRVAPPAWLLADHASRVGEQRVVNLDDGSRVVLNTDSAIDVQYTAAERRIVLRQGEILAVVARDAGQRPFVVATRDGTAVARGTRYVVRMLSNSTQVSVTESRVSVCPGDETLARCRDVAAGQSMYLSRTQVAAGPAVDPEAAEAWTRQRLSVRDASLVQVLDELSRYRRGVFWYDSSALADLRVSGVFPLDGDQALAVLADSLPIAINSGIPGVTRIERRPVAR
ncbi:FecR domain-containing protein [Achromobacter xylosoxidans]|uniref:Fec operon regulator FecR n=1 Tax=Alcaligenes xylosoxydans xylosoxydans TaxID=85698 RepID=A0A1R1JV35_ALCXX|nr:FecR family protein [Achromobacter xylosoxidans]OMG89090.1 hypothetical protein BIZ92_25485 [Achromobacter xylosoxidans]